MVEHQSRKLGVVGSNPTGGNILSFVKLEKISSQLAGFEPTRAEPIGFQVQRLNHSATTALVIYCKKFKLEMRGIEPRAFHMQSERSTTELHPLWFEIAGNVLANESISQQYHRVTLVQEANFPFTGCLRPYQVENTSSRLITEVKQL